MIVEPTFPLNVGYCVYCESTEDLSDEHIIPVGLSGQWQLLAASCRRHRDITSAFEFQVLHRDLIAIRTTLGLRTRRPKERPTVLPLTVRTEDGPKDLSLPIASHPGGAAFPVYPPPSELAGEATAESSGGWVVRSHFPSLLALATEHGATAYDEIAVERLAFARLLAKIAYCFAAGCLHPQKVTDSCLLPLIEGASSDYSRWIGNSGGSDVTEANQGHHVTLAFSDRGLIAYIRILAELALPEYTVVVRPRAP